MNAHAEKARSEEVLPEVPQEDATQEVQRHTGVDAQLPSSEVLRSGVHGGVDGGPDQEPDPAEQQTTVGQGGQVEVRGVRPEEHAAVRSPQRREPDEQQTVEPVDLVRLLPSSLALAQLHGDAASAEALLTVLKACEKEGLLLHAPDQAAEAWRSLPRQARQRIRNAIDAAGLLRSIEPPLLAGTVPARVVRLRGYGNAIVPQVAAEFVRAFMECKA